MKIILTRRNTLRWILAGLVILLLLAAAFRLELFLGGGSFGGGPSRAIPSEVRRASRGLTEYRIDVEFDPGRKLLICNQRVEYRNHERESLGELFFHLYPNVFKDRRRVPFPQEDMGLAYPNGFSSGYMRLKEVRVEGTPVSFTLKGESSDILHLPLPKVIKPGKTITIDMEYLVKLPNCLGRFGYGDTTYNVTNWYPILSVYDETGWNNDPYYEIGDPFYSDAANYKVTIHGPEDLVIASTGMAQKRVEGDRGIWTIEAYAVRDFAWLAGRRENFKVFSREVDGTMVYSYSYEDEAGEAALDYAAEAIRIFNKAFGKYPYRQFSVVEADFFIGGMEYPHIVLIDKALYRPEVRQLLEYVVVHEAAHQWWYGLVGNDEIDESWLDEALTEYSTILYYGKRYGPQRQERMFQTMVIDNGYGRLEALTEGQKEKEIIHKPTYEFEDMWVYDSLVYGKGAVMFRELHKEMGDQDFEKFLQTYYREMKYKNATKEDLLKACRKATGKEWKDFFQKWLYDE